MDLEDKIQGHFFYDCADDINKICAPLFNTFQIKYFAYLRKYPDNSIVVLNSCRSWMLNYARKGYPISVGQQQLYTWQASMPQNAVTDAATNFNFHNGIVVQKVHQNYIEMLEFAAPNQLCDPMGFCCNKYLFNQFLLYFKDKASKIMQRAENERLVLPELVFNKMEAPTQFYDKFCASIKPHKIRLLFNQREIVFTRREYEVISLLTGGKTMKQAALILKLSPKTIETYLNRAKNRAQAFSTTQLLEGVADNLY